METPNLDHFIKRYLAGESLRQLGKELSVDRKQLACWLRGANVQLRSQADSARLANGARVENVAELAARYQAGETLASLARQVGVNVVTLRKRLEGMASIRSVSENSRRFWTKRLPDIERLAARYVAGEPLELLAREAGVRNATLRRKFVLRGMPIRFTSEIITLDADELKRRYLAGESLKALSDAHGVARNVIALRLQRAGVKLRGTAEAACLPQGNIARAATKHARLLAITPAEKALASALRSIGLPVDPQHPVGAYNLDLAFHEQSVAVEVESGPAFGYPQNIKLRERLEEILNAGWCVLYVVHLQKPIIIPAVIRQVLTLLDLASRDESLRGKYGVIGRDGEPYAKARYQFDGLPRIEGF